MRPDRLLIAAGALAAALSGCAGCQLPGPGDGGGDGGGLDDGGAFAQSAKGVVRFKRNARLSADFAGALGLTQAELCNELGLYSCAATVHALTLGGTDPYGSGLYEPLPYTGVTTPLATDRIALSACTNRVGKDLAVGATPVIFKNLPVGPDGKLVNAEGAEVSAALDTLYQRALLRDPTPAEKSHLKQLYADIVASGKPEPAKAWMILSCFAVTTSVEFLFY